MKFSVSLMFDPDLHAAAKAYANEKKISFSRLVHEAVCAALGREGRLTPEVQKAIEDRIAVHPGRKPLSVDEKRRRALERVQRQYPDARLAVPGEEPEKTMRGGQIIVGEEE